MRHTLAGSRGWCQTSRRSQEAHESSDMPGAVHGSATRHPLFHPPGHELIWLSYPVFTLSFPNFLVSNPARHDATLPM